jgi:hypothetical protein
MTNPERINPARWRTAGELDALAAAVETRLARDLRPLYARTVLDDRTREQHNRDDRAGIVEARRRAVWHRSEAGRLANTRDDLADQATADFLAARADARTIRAGPGRLGRKTGQVEAAQARRDETARRWNTPQPPGADWPDTTVQQAAEQAAERVVNTGIRYHNDQTGREEHTAATLDGYLSTRDRDHRAAIEANEVNASQRDALIAAAQIDRDRIAGHRQTRDRHILTMTPEQITAADQARNDHLNEQARHQVGVVRRGPQPSAQPELPDRGYPTRPPEHERDDQGHGFEM